MGSVAVGRVGCYSTSSEGKTLQKISEHLQEVYSRSDLVRWKIETIIWHDYQNSLLYQVVSHLVSEDYKYIFALKIFDRNTCNLLCGCVPLPPEERFLAYQRFSDTQPR